MQWGIQESILPWILVGVWPSSYMYALQEVKKKSRDKKNFSRAAISDLSACVIKKRDSLLLLYKLVIESLEHENEYHKQTNHYSYFRRTNVSNEPLKLYTGDIDLVGTTWNKTE